MHSYQNALYFAAQRLRCLAAGEAFASFVDSAGMHTAHVHVPYVKPVSVSDSTFISIRTLIFSRSPSAIETPNAISQLEQHEAQLLIEAQRVPQLQPEPISFRVPATRKKEAVDYPGRLCGDAVQCRMNIAVPPKTGKTLSAGDAPRGME